MQLRYTWTTHIQFIQVYFIYTQCQHVHIPAHVYMHLFVMYSHKFLAWRIVGQTNNISGNKKAPGFTAQFGTVASWLVRLTPDCTVWVQYLAGTIVWCSWARHFTLTVPISTQVYDWVLANLMLGVTLRWTSIPSRGSTIIPSCFILQKLG